MSQLTTYELLDKSGASSPTRNWRKFFNLHSRRMLLELINFLFNHDWIYWIVGRANKRIGLIESVFMVYPATEAYALHYFYPHMIRRHPWWPGPSGLLWQDGKLTVMFAISAMNGQLVDPENIENLRQVAERMEKIRNLLSAQRKTFAGILPGVLFRNRIIRQAPEAELTAEVVVQAVDTVKAQESLDRDVPIIVLGGKGFIGRRLIRLLGRQNVYCIDVVDRKDSSDWPNQLCGKPAIVINVSLNQAIKDYLDVIWPGTVVINEVYPEPTPEVLERLSKQGSSCYHVVGIRALALPSFPSAYAGAIPCCAAWPSPDKEVVLQKLN